MQNDGNSSHIRRYNADHSSSIIESCMWKNTLYRKYRKECKSVLFFLTDTTQSRLLAVTVTRKLLCKMHLQRHMWIVHSLSGECSRHWKGRSGLKCTTEKSSINSEIHPFDEIANSILIWFFFFSQPWLENNLQLCTKLLRRLKEQFVLLIHQVEDKHET